MTDQTPPQPPDDGDGPVHTAVEPIEIQEEMESSFLDYAMSVITARALPDARDGLKPVHRRILYGMDGLGARPDRSHMKCARITGDVMGKYHPHGEGAIYDSLVRMAQDFSLRHPLGRRARQLRQPRLRAGGVALHRGAAQPAGDADARRHHRGHRRLQRQLLGRRRGAQRPARPLPQPARQRQPGDRGRHGHQHPSPQPGRGHRRHRPPHRQPGGDARRPDAVRAGPRLPHRRADHGPPGDHRRLPHGEGLDPAAGGVRDRGGERARRRPDRGHGDAVPDLHLGVRGAHRRAGADARRSRASATSTTSRRVARRASSSS